MNARDYALVQLDRTPLPGWPSRLSRRAVVELADPRDRALAERIRAGVIKNHTLLQHLIDHHARRPGRIDPLVRKILSIAIYQLRFLSRVPAAAVVDEAVEQARRFGRPHAARFVNALLRSDIRRPDVPLPDELKNPTQYAAIVLSHPPQLFARLAELLGVEAALQLCRHNNAEPPTLVRLYKGISAAQLQVADVVITPHQSRGICVVEGATRSTLSAWAASGLAQVQDAAAAGVVPHLGIEPGQHLCDRCCGMGTKTLQMRDELGDTGWIVAIDPAETRCDALRAMLSARNISNIAVCRARSLRRIIDLRAPCFDGILADVPCSNSGVLARRPEARFSQTPAAIQRLTKLQDQILQDTAPYVLGGGVLVYSTCSIWPDENQQRVDRFLDQNPDFRQIHGQTILPYCPTGPTSYHDGGFIAVLKRR